MEFHSGVYKKAESITLDGDMSNEHSEHTIQPACKKLAVCVCVDSRRDQLCDTRLDDDDYYYISVHSLSPSNR